MHEKFKTDIRMNRDELHEIERCRSLKEKSVAQCQSSLEAMRATKESLESELHQDLMEQLSVADQERVGFKLTKEIQFLNLYL